MELPKWIILSFFVSILVPQNPQVILTSDIFFITIHSSSLVVRILHPLQEIKPTYHCTCCEVCTRNFGSWHVFIHSSSSSITKWIDKEKDIRQTRLHVVPRHIVLAYFRWFATSSLQLYVAFFNLQLRFTCKHYHRSWSA